MSKRLIKICLISAALAGLIMLLEPFTGSLIGENETLRLIFAWTFSILILVAVVPPFFAYAQGVMDWVEEIKEQSSLYNPAPTPPKKGPPSAER